MLTWWLFISAIFLSNVFESSSKDVWQKPGCHKVAVIQEIAIPNCVVFNMRTNICQGFCESWSIPSGPRASPNQPVTSVGACCSMMETESLSAQVYCYGGMRNLTLKSAKTCECYHCKKD